MTTTTDGKFAPCWRLLATEPLRAVMEYAGMQLMDKQGLPTGDGHPVVIFPGLATDARVVAPLRSLCERLGYAAHDWGRGFNTGPEGDVDEWLTTLQDEVCQMLLPYRDPVSLIGWSLGGIYARELAKLMPDRVRRVITIGTPFAGDASHTNVGALYRLLSGQLPHVDEELQTRLRAAPPVPTTSIYSRGDGVVAWQACVDDVANPLMEHVEVSGSHCGMSWNPEVLTAVAQRLARRH